jgi:hypothetical protein
MYAPHRLARFGTSRENPGNRYCALASSNHRMGTRALSFAIEKALHFHVQRVHGNSDRKDGGRHSG